MHVMKFGGSSVGTPARIKQVAAIVRAAHQRHRNIVAVFSAFQGVTDQLIATAKLAATGDTKYSGHLRTLKRRHLSALAELVPASRRGPGEAFVRTRLDELSDVLHGVFFTREVTPRMMDYIMSFGELLSTSIIAETLKSSGARCEFLDRRLVIKTDGTFGAARVRYDLTNRLIRSHCRKHPGLLIATGFIASTTDNDTTTLGRGGSDFTASIFGAAVDAREIEIWTDVDGVNTADPRKVKDALSVRSMTYNEAMEMSHFGAKVIHPPTMQPALKNAIPIRIKNTFNPGFPGTVITRSNEQSVHAIKGLSSIDDVALLRIQGSGLVGTAGIGRRVFSALAAKEINVLMVTMASSEYSLCLVVAPADAEPARRLISEELRLEMIDGLIDDVIVERNLSVVAIVGENMRKTTGIAGKLYRALGQSGVNVVAIAQGSSELNISTVVERTDESKALNAIHDAFFRSHLRTINVFLLGTGTVGGALLGQIERQQESLRNTRHIDVRIRGILNSRQMLFADHDLPAQWRSRLNASRSEADLQTFAQAIRERHLPNSVVVDCTATNDPVHLYEKLLASGISIVAANKRANASSQKLYDRLRLAQRRGGSQFLYETNVGAGLPLIGTVHDLNATGDAVHRIEGTLSGTLSYLFNSLKEGTRFSSIVQDAQRRGFTEPDPREDLNGLDVARKLLILARECGYRLELRDITVTPAVPSRFMRARSVKEFLRSLTQLDDWFEQKRKDAARRGMVLRYIASLDHGKADVAVREVDATHPAYGLTGSDVLVAITTKHYAASPLIIRGPGAGADVTAAGVFADILRARDRDR